MGACSFSLLWYIVALLVDNVGMDEHVWREGDLCTKWAGVNTLYRPGDLVMVKRVPAHDLPLSLHRAPTNSRGVDDRCGDVNPMDCGLVIAVTLTGEGYWDCVPCLLVNGRVGWFRQTARLSTIQDAP